MRQQRKGAQRAAQGANRRVIQYSARPLQTLPIGSTLDAWQVPNRPLPLENDDSLPRVGSLAAPSAPGDSDRPGNHVAGTTDPSP